MRSVFVKLKYRFFMGKKKKSGLNCFILEKEKKRKKRHFMQAESRNSTGTSDLLSMLSRTTSATTAEHFNWAYFVLFSVSHTQKDSKERQERCSNS